MFRSLLLNLVLAGTCAAQPPSRLDRLVLPSPEAQQQELLRQHLKLLQLRRSHIEAHMLGHERMLRESADVIPPGMARDMRETLQGLRESFEKAQSQEREIANELGISLLPLAPMPRAHLLPLAPPPREKRID
jgi:hypothetical protein